MFYLVLAPCFVLTEGMYLLRHPRTFNGLAAFLWAVITGASGFLISEGSNLHFVPVVQVFAIVVYYVVKLLR